MLNILTNYDGIGPVYAITLLYFITQGRYPIYDRFAHIALREITMSDSFWHITTDQELRREFHADAAKVEKIYKDYVKYYIKRLEDIFGNQYQTDRDIDRALWAYGHLFNDTKANRKRIKENDKFIWQR